MRFDAGTAHFWASLRYCGDEVYHLTAFVSWAFNGLPLRRTIPAFVAVPGSSNTSLYLPCVFFEMYASVTSASSVASSVPLLSGPSSCATAGN